VSAALVIPAFLDTLDIANSRTFAAQGTLEKNLGPPQYKDCHFSRRLRPIIVYEGYARLGTASTVLARPRLFLFLIDLVPVRRLHPEEITEKRDRASPAHRSPARQLTGQEGVLSISWKEGHLRMTIESKMTNDLFSSCHRYHQGFEGCQVLKDPRVHKNPKAGERAWNGSPRAICEKCAHGLFEIIGLHCLLCHQPVSRVHSSQGPTTWDNWTEHRWFYYKCDSCRKNCYSQSELGK
jgi:hypothetical protein